MILDDIVAAKRIRLAEHKARIDEETMKQQALAMTEPTRGFYEALADSGLSVIGEFKQKSPSHGKMDNKINLEERMSCYNGAVNAISVLTEEDYFNGNVEDLKKIRNMTELPIIRKDFIIEDYQVYEARVIGADAILLIAAILEDDRFKHLYELAYSLGLDVLCEVHNEEELERMLAADVKILGINNRNLKTFEISLDTTRRLTKLAETKSGSVIVSESGVTTDTDIQILKESDVNALLIGTALMESENPDQLVNHWRMIYEEN